MPTPMRLIMLLLASATAVAPAARAQIYINPPSIQIQSPPQFFVRGHVRWAHRARVVFAPPQVVIQPVAAPVWIAPEAPSPPPPPVYMAPPPVIIEPQQPIYVQPQPIYAPAPMYAQPPMYPPPQYAPPPGAARPAQQLVAQAPPKPDWTARFGLGATGEGLVGLHGDKSQGFGVLGQLRFRAARHFVLELQGGYERVQNKDAMVRTDVPITAGMMIPILGPERLLSPYFVGAIGLNFSNLKILDAPTLQIEDKRVQSLAQVGFGLELRLGRHFALNTDARLEGRWSIDPPSDAVKATSSVNGKPVTPIQDTLGLRLGGGASIYF